MVTRYALLNFLFTVLIGSPILATSMLFWEGQGDAEEILGFSLLCMVVSAICGAPTLIGQIITVNVRRELPVGRRLDRNHIAQAIGAAVTFVVIGVGLYMSHGEMMFLLAVFAAYGIVGAAVGAVMYNRFKRRQHVEQRITEDVLDLEFDRI